VISRIYRALCDPRSFWREVFRYGYQERHRSPKDWFLFRHEVAKQCAIRRRPPSGLPSRRVEDLFPDILNRTCTVQYAPPTAYNVSWDELLILASLVRLLKPRALFEFGTFDGRTTLHLALNAPDARVSTLDVEDDYFSFGNDEAFFSRTRVGMHLLMSDQRERVTLLKGDSTKFDFSQYEGTFDFIFVDGGHAYDVVQSDSQKAFDIVSDRGLIVWHDYLVIDDVTRALVEVGAQHELISLEGTSLVIHRVGSERS